jgi:SOS-response transcriptional repressor LexA
LESRNEPTLTQEKVFDFLKDFLRRKGFPPTLREIASHFGLRGPKGPQKTLNILERKGYIRKIPRGSRAVEIIGSKVGRHSGLPYKMGFVESATSPTFPIPTIGRVQAGVVVKNHGFTLLGEDIFQAFLSSKIEIIVRRVRIKPRPMGAGVQEKAWYRTLFANHSTP